MGVQKGDVLDEAKRFDESCRLVVEIVEGGGGFSKIDCCGNELTAEDIVDAAADIERSGNDEVKEIIIDESKNNPESCGLKLKIKGGGAGLQSITCCGNELTVEKDAV